ncbi:MAG: hypothetical protein KJ077_10885 [Anaerolineae bacterium]|nr:hypothetical protein [Anaerolineae bacterium]
MDDKLEQFLRIKRLLPEMAALPQWIGYKLRPSRRPNKLDKLPINPRTGGLAMTNNAETWGTFEAACKAVSRHQLDGIGFVFTLAAGIIGVDLDSCIVDDQMQPWASQIVAELDSYTEVSPSGSGVHILLRGTLPPTGCKAGRIEVYSWGRFFTVTGQLWSGAPASIQTRQGEIWAFHQRIFSSTKEIKKNG